MISGSGEAGAGFDVDRVRVSNVETMVASLLEELIGLLIGSLLDLEATFLLTDSVADFG